MALNEARHLGDLGDEIVEIPITAAGDVLGSIQSRISRRSPGARLI